MTIEEKEHRKVIDIFGGYPVKEYLNEKVNRWYVYLPVNSGAREYFGKKEGRMLRSHYVYCRANSIPGMPKTHVIHHVDGDRGNDDIENLQMLTHEQHNLIHDSDPRCAGGQFKGRRHSYKTIQKLTEIARRNGYNGQWDGAKKNHFPETIERMSASSTGVNNSQYRHDIPTEGVRRAYERLQDLNAVAEIFGCSVQAVRNRIQTAGSVSVDWKTIPDAELLKMLDECCGNQRKLALKIQAPGTSLFRRLNKIRGISNARP